MNKFRLLLLLFLFPAFLQAQVKLNVKDSINKSLCIIGSYAFQFPGGDMADRFGVNSNVGLAAIYKNKKNWFYGGQWSFMFGDKVKENTMLLGIATADSFVIDQEGTYAQIRFYERGMNLSFYGGKLFPVLSPNKNSGILLMGGLGGIYHKIRIEDVGNRAPQLRGDYKKGYDRLTGGLAVSEFVGYWFMSKSRLVNFYGGFDLSQNFTKSMRSWNIDQMAADTKQRTDLLYGFRVGWVLPLYKRQERQYYYN
jgi:hypothetical protein